MTEVRSIPDEVDAAVRAWRAGATNIVLVVLAVAGLPPVVCAVLGMPFVLPLPHRWVGVSVYGALVVALSIRRRHYRWRATILLSFLYLLAADQLAVYGLVGDGRIALLVLPLLALILLGAREGWIAASVTAIMLAVFTLLAGNGVSVRWKDIRENSVHSEFWLLPGLLLGALIPLMVLLTRFLALQMRTMVVERQARRELENESAMRRYLEGEIMRVGEDERRRLGSDLHDGLCQHLTAALLHCTAVENQLAAREMPEAGPASQLRSMIEESIGMAYDVAKGLCPLDLNPGALVSALERLVRQTRKTAGLVCEFRNQGEVAIRDPQKALHLFRIAQEAVTNAVKHAHGRVIQVELLSTADSLTLRIQDDGVCQRPEADTEAGGMGVRLMAFRADAIGGTLTIDHPTGGGTVVTCRVPAETPKDSSA